MEENNNVEVTNILDIRLHKASLPYLVGKLSEKNTLLSFDQILPTPQELKEIVVGSVFHPSNPNQRIHLWKEYKDNIFPLSEEEYHLLVYTYGYSNWLDWRLANWGCQYNPTGISVFQLDPETVRFKFTTDNEPDKIREKLTNPDFQKTHLGYEAIQGVEWLVESRELAYC